MAKNLTTTVLTVAVISGLVLATGANSEAGQQQFRRLAVKDYVDKMKAGWIGQMAGVGWGAPTEFGWRGAIIPKDKMPKWKPELINQFRQDDIYVEMTFLRTLELHGLNVSARQAGIDFARPTPGTRSSQPMPMTLTIKSKRTTRASSRRECLTWPLNSVKYSGA
ncbi:MAG: hypothetical protein ACYS32_19365 [Planctomycetota bacterium]|jgi:hypothetical protein